MVLDDDTRRHRWFVKRFRGDFVDVALETVAEAKELLEEESYDAIFLDHDLLPHHYESNSHNDFENTGFAIAEYLNQNPGLQSGATIIVHTRNARTLAIPMVEKLRETGRNAEYCAFPMLDLKISNYWRGCLETCARKRNANNATKRSTITFARSTIAFIFFPLRSIR